MQRRKRFYKVDFAPFWIVTRAGLRSACGGRTRIAIANSTDPQPQIEEAEKL